MTSPNLLIDRLFRPVSSRPLAGLRVGLALLLLTHLAWLADDVLALHGNRGIIPWELTAMLRHPWVPGLPTLANALVPLGINAHNAAILWVAIYAGSLVALALGFHTRLAAFFTWALHLSLVTGGFASFYGADQIAHTFLFYIFLFPSGRAWNFVTRDSESSREDTMPGACLWVMRFHLCVIYFAAGIDKAMGAQWWNGEAIWRAVTQPAFRTSDTTWLANYAWLPMLAGWGTLVVEIGYPLFMSLPRTRRLWFLAVVGLHLGIALSMGLIFFSSLMILLTTCLFMIPEDVERPIAKKELPPLAAAWLPAVCLALLPAVFLAPLGNKANAEGLPSPTLSDDFAPLIRRLMARDQIPGVAVGLVDREKLVFARSFGYRDAERRLPITPDTLFPIGSCSKAFTATAIALLANEGKLAFDTPVRRYLSDFALEDPTATNSLTTRDLLTHRSGLPRHDFFWYKAPFTRDELYARIRYLEPAGPPRVEWRYNSLMYVVAGRIIEKVSGDSWEGFIRKRILAPLSMRRTVLSPEETEADLDHASGYVLRRGRAHKMEMLKPLSAIAPAGGVSTSVRDLARWLSFHAIRSPQLLSARIWGELHRPQAAMPASDQAEIINPSYALGWVHQTYRGHALVVHNGAIDGYTVHLGFFPKHGRGLIILMNRDLAVGALLTIAYNAYDHLLGLTPLNWEERFKEVPEPVSEASHVALDFPISDVVGRYEHPAYGAISILSHASADGGRLEMRFRSFRFALDYLGNRQFLGAEPIVDGGPQIKAWFSNPKAGEASKLFVPLNFDPGDPVQVFTRRQP
jgi:CubicO group peptidase (beta-lactamase class C family)